KTEPEREERRPRELSRRVLASPDLHDRATPEDAFAVVRAKDSTSKARAAATAWRAGAWAATATAARRSSRASRRGSAASKGLRIPLYPGAVRFEAYREQGAADRSHLMSFRGGERAAGSDRRRAPSSLQAALAAAAEGLAVDVARRAVGAEDRRCLEW